jgi:SET domain-containing protein
MALMIRSSAIHAAGCYTTTAIRKGVRVAEYTGHMMTKKAADQRYEDSPVTYLYGLGRGSKVIDGHSMAMFINHSCDANCESEEIDGHVYIAAVRNIAAGEEITYDYCLYDGGEDEATCNCGERKCRGTMYSPQEVKNRKAAARKAASKRKPRSGSKASKKRKR